MDYRVAIDANNAITSPYHTNFDVQGIPHAFIIDKNGKIVYSGHPMEPKFETKLAEAVAFKKAPPVEKMVRLDVRLSPPLPSRSCSHRRAVLFCRRPRLRFRHFRCRSSRQHSKRKASISRIVWKRVTWWNVSSANVCASARSPPRLPLRSFSSRLLLLVV